MQFPIQIDHKSTKENLDPALVDEHNLDPALIDEHKKLFNYTKVYSLLPLVDAGRKKESIETEMTA